MTASNHAKEPNGTGTSARVPRYRLHKPSGRAIVQYQGRRYYLGKYGTPESLRRYAALLARLAQAEPTEAASSPPAAEQPPGGLLIVELVAAYWEHCQSYYQKDGKPTQWLWTIRSALKPLTAIYGRTAAAEFGPRRFKAVREEYVKAGMRRSTVNKMGGIIKRMFKWAAAEELLPGSIWQNLRAVEGLRKGRTTAPEPKPIPPVDDRTIEATLPYLSPVVADMVRFQRLTGCRPGEVCSIRPMDVDQSGRLWLYTPADHKTAHHGKQRLIVIGPRAQDVLRLYLHRPPTAHCFSPAQSEAQHRAQRHAARKTPLHYGNRPGTNRKRKPKRRPRDCYTSGSYARAVVYGTRKANRALLAAHLAAGGRAEDAPQIPRWTPNQLRHATATEIRKSFGLEAAQVVLGHTRADVTEVYAERDLAKAFEVMEQMG